MSRRCGQSIMSHSAMVLLFFVILFSCKEASECDTKTYEPPLITLTGPGRSAIEVPWDSIVEFRFFFQTGAGLNTLFMNGEPIHAFTGVRQRLIQVLTPFFVLILDNPTSIGSF
jgi:hypothetical protein